MKTFFTALQFSLKYLWVLFKNIFISLDEGWVIIFWDMPDFYAVRYSKGQGRTCYKIRNYSSKQWNMASLEADGTLYMELPSEAEGYRFWGQRGEKANNNFKGQLLNAVRFTYLKFQEAGLTQSKLTFPY